MGFSLSFRNRLKKINDDLSPLPDTPGLDSELDKLQVLLERLEVEYKAKSNSAETTLGPDDTGQLHKLLT